jgi:hypothetical protein
MRTIWSFTDRTRLPPRAVAGGWMRSRWPGASTMGDPGERKSPAITSPMVRFSNGLGGIFRGRGMTRSYASRAGRSSWKKLAARANSSDLGGEANEQATGRQKSALLTKDGWGMRNPFAASLL